MTYSRTRILALGTFFLPVLALAHTRWFAHSDLPSYHTNEPTALYISLWGVLALVIVVIGAFLERKKLLQLSFLLPKRENAFARATGTFTVTVGAFFLIAGTHEYLFSPNLTPAAGIPYVLIIVQILAGLTFLVGVYTRVAAVLLAAVWALAFYSAGVVAMLEDVWVLGTALFVFIVGSDYLSLVPRKALANITHRYQEYTLPILRLGTGTTLFVLGFSEKILRPELGINFLSEYHWNFMQNLGFAWYSDYLFTISAGAVESLIGLIFILGIITRLNTLVLAIFFTIPMFILGPIELAGHLPHFAAVLLLLLFGGGNRLKLFSNRVPAHH